MILEAGELDCAAEVIPIVAALSIQDPRERPQEQRAQADQQHARFADETSDFLAYLNLWRYLREQQRALSGSQFRKRCKAEYLHYVRVREWQDLAGELRRSAKELGISLNQQPAEPAAVHRALLSGLLSHLGVKDAQGREYLGARGGRFAIFPGSGAGEEAAGVGDGRRAGGDLAAVGPRRRADRPEVGRAARGAPRLAHLLRAALGGEPRLRRGDRAGDALRAADRHRAAPSSTAASTPCSRASCSSGARSSRASGRPGTRSGPPTRRCSRRSTRSSSAPAAATCASRDEALFAFYDERIPPEIVSGAHFDRWWRDARREDPDLLTYTPELLVTDEAAAALDRAGRPSEWKQGEIVLPLSYRFEPGAEHDGVTVHVPLKVLPQLRDAGFDWLVPAFREELVTALIRSLPKDARRRLVPVPDVAAEVHAALKPRKGRFADAGRRRARAAARRARHARRLRPRAAARPPADDVPGRGRAAARWWPRAPTWARCASGPGRGCARSWRAPRAAWRRTG